MAKKLEPRGTSTSRAHLLSPLYTAESSKSLGGEPVEGPKSGKATPDPLKFAPFNLQNGEKGKSKSV